MKKAIVFSSLTGNTEKLAKTILGAIDGDVYCGKPSDDALDADMIFVGSWTTGSSCTPDIKEFLEKLHGKKVFVFATAGYGHSEDFFNSILKSIKENINSSNEIIGEYMCQGAVSAAKQEGIKKMDMAKYEKMKAELEYSQGYPNEENLATLASVVKALV